LHNKDAWSQMPSHHCVSCANNQTAKIPFRTIRYTQQSCINWALIRTSDEVHPAPPPPWCNAFASSLSRLHDHTQTHHTQQDSSGRVMSPALRPLTDNTKQLHDRHQFPRRDSNPQTQKVSRRRTGPWTARSLGSATKSRNGPADRRTDSPLSSTHCSID
jgi:hypothetical protein